eukprot:2537593-Pleurochrysis_carterae.AAC.1
MFLRDLRVRVASAEPAEPRPRHISPAGQALVSRGHADAPVPTWCRCAHARARARMNARTHERTRTHARMHARARTHACTHAHERTHARTHVYAYARARSHPRTRGTERGARACLAARGCHVWA